MMRFNDAAGYGQAEAAAFALPAFDALMNLRKFIKNYLFSFRRYPDACIADGDLYGARVRQLPECDVYRASRGRKFQRISNQVDEHLLDSFAVDQDFRQSRGYLDI